MRAMHYSRFGPAADVLELATVDTPSPAAGEVLVRLAYSGVNPSDSKARAGTRPGVTKPAFDQIIPHSDGSGVIKAVGDDVDQSRIGQRVWIYNGQWQRAFGTAAEYIALPAEQAVPLPEDVSLETGATLGIPGLTATQTVFGGGDVTGKTLLISGGAGAVGHNAVQLAKWAGATVIATASPSGNDRVRAAGAEHVLDYNDPELPQKIMDLSNGGVDRAIEVEFGTNAALLAEVMKPLGTVATYGSGKALTPELPFGPYLFKALKIDITLIYILPAPERAAAIVRLHQALSDGALQPAIATTYPLESCAEAQDAVMTSGRTGAVLLDMQTT
ncbi:Phthiocerol synthesis polyketide synthase type I PpsC [Roseovarius albus]|uniref:Phthiocerol synthesis polyketide synthase type I PpsC n=1 Tax=Roseovarius albus TaxID=1247867 RepID=A0A1X6ZGZ8_9RHOB|nr:NADPH:quinone reductase [Roseovarius albus]SLN50979.1 Phthiocerol synthesis polyketide synthase type I PpsC [Roseovarius albus]